MRRVCGLLMCLVVLHGYSRDVSEIIAAGAVSDKCGTLSSSGGRQVAVGRGASAH